MDVVKSLISLEKVVGFEVPAITFYLDVNGKKKHLGIISTKVRQKLQSRATEISANLSKIKMFKGKGAEATADAILKSKRAKIYLDSSYKLYLEYGPAKPNPSLCVDRAEFTNEFKPNLIQDLADLLLPEKHRAFIANNWVALGGPVLTYNSDGTPRAIYSNFSTELTVSTAHQQAKKYFGSARVSGINQEWNHNSTKILFPMSENYFSISFGDCSFASITIGIHRNKNDANDTTVALASSISLFEFTKHHYRFTNTIQGVFRGNGNQITLGKVGHTTEYISEDGTDVTLEKCRKFSLDENFLASLSDNDILEIPLNENELWVDYCDRILQSTIDSVDESEVDQRSLPTKKQLIEIASVFLYGAPPEVDYLFVCNHDKAWYASLSDQLLLNLGASAVENDSSLKPEFDLKMQELKDKDLGFQITALTEPYSFSKKPQEVLKIYQNYRKAKDNLGESDDFRNEFFNKDNGERWSALINRISGKTFGLIVCSSEQLTSSLGAQVHVEDYPELKVEANVINENEVSQVQPVIFYIVENDMDRVINQAQFISYYQSGLPLTLGIHFKFAPLVEAAWLDINGTTFSIWLSSLALDIDEMILSGESLKLNKLTFDGFIHPNSKSTIGEVLFQTYATSPKQKHMYVLSSGVLMSLPR